MVHPILTWLSKWRPSKLINKGILYDREWFSRSDLNVQLDTYFLKKEEVEWLLKILPKLVKKMKSERQPPESDAPLSDNGKGDEGD